MTLFGDSVYDIGDHSGTVFTPDGVQYGFGVDVDTTTNAVVQDVNVSQYQKEGFLMYQVTGSVTSNQAVGLGPVNFIAANGFEIDSSQLSRFRTIPRCSINIPAATTARPATFFAA